MGSNQQFSLRWNNYVQHVTQVFDSLRDEENLVDVTLCCEGRKLRAHRILLSACSGYFREIFKENPCPHPVIIFQNVKYEDLEALVCFMYKGEVNVDQEGLSSFLSTAELLEVKGLIGSGSCDPENLVEDEPSKSETKSIKKLSPKPNSKPDAPLVKKRKGHSDKISPTYEKTTSQSELNFYGGADSEDGYEDPGGWMDSDQIKSEETFENSHSGEENTDKIAVQPEGSSNDDGNIQESLQVFAHGLWRRLHPSLKRFGCDECGKVFKHPRSLDHHKKMHEGRTTCPLCSRVFGPSDGRREIFTCYVCEEVFSDSSTLTKHHLDLHTSSLSMGKASSDHLHNCPVCQARFKYSRNLREHMKSHSGLTKCLGCDKSLSSRANLRRHLLMLHTHGLLCLICKREFDADRLQMHMCSSHSIGWM